MSLEAQSVAELRKVAGDLSIPGRGEMNKAELIEAIEHGQDLATRVSALERTVADLSARLSSIAAHTELMA